MQNASRERTRCGQHRELLVFMRAALPEVAPGVELRGNYMFDIRTMLFVWLQLIDSFNFISSVKF